MSACCTTTDPCRRCRLWDELAGAVPVRELRPCVLCPDLWPATALDPRTRLCPACTAEIQERQAAEAAIPESVEDIEELRRRAQQRRWAQFEEARRRMRELPPEFWGPDVLAPAL